jgi:UDP-glucose 4-epimerase
MKRVVLTGATGFVGANLTRRLLREGHEVHLLLRANHNDWRIQTIINDLNIHIVNLNDVEGLTYTLSSIHPDWIFHLAAYGAYSSQKNLQQMAATNLLATANLVDVCCNLGFEAFINTGSSSEYGYKDHAPSENEWIEPNSSYAVTKAAATHYCRFIAQSRQVNLATVRLYSVFGPYEEPTRLIPSLIVEGLEGKLPLLVNPDIARDYVFVDDISEAYLRLASSPSGVSTKVYNLGSGKQVSLREVVEITAQELHLSVNPVWGSMPDRQWDTSIWVANIENVRRDIRWQPEYSFTQGFQQTVNWFFSNPEMLTYYKTHREVPR